MSLIKNITVDEYTNESITHAPSKKLKNIKMLKSSQNSRRGSVEKTQIDYSQESKHPCMTKAYDNALKRRLDSSEIKIMKIEKQILSKMLEKITKEYEELKKITNEYEELKRVYTLMKQE